MGRELKLFLCALQFLTRLPVPALPDFVPDWITRSAKYFPLIGQVVGALSAAAIVLAAQVWPGLIPALLAITVGILATGAFHEDGLADTADGLGGGQNCDQRLTIMKDSRIGTYGMLALALCLALKVAVLSSLEPARAVFILIAMHGAARAAAVVAMTALSYAGDPAAAKSKPVPVGVTPVECLLAVVFAAWPMFLLPLGQVLYGIAIGCLLAVVIALAARRLIGGYTGDVLGAVEQLFELGFLLGVAAL